MHSVSYTHLHEAVKNGYRAYMVTLEDLLTCLKTRDVSRHAMKTYKRITKAQLLAIYNATLCLLYTSTERKNNIFHRFYLERIKLFVYLRT